MSKPIIIKNLVFLLPIILLANLGLSQFSQLKQRPSSNPANLIHSAIAKSKKNSNFYALSSTVHTVTRNHIAVQKLDSNGVTVWEKEIQMSLDDKVLDVLIDQRDNIVITGYTSVSGTKQLYIAKFNSNGRFINDFILGTPNQSVGTRIIESAYSPVYYIGGYESTADKAFNMKGNALLISVNSDLTKKSWESEYSSSGVNNTIADIVELPNQNLFITGSAGKSKVGQIVLATIVNPNSNGDIIPGGDMSFSLPTDFSLGASACYDHSKDEITLLFNAGSTNKAHLINIRDVSTPEPIMSDDGIEIDIIFFDKYAGFKILPSTTGNNNVTIFGYYDYCPRYNSGFGMFVLDVNKYSGRASTSIKLWDPSGATTGVEREGGGVLSLFSSSLSTGAPYFHTPSIAVEAHNGKNFVSLTVDKISSYTEVGVLSYEGDLKWAISPCLKALDFSPKRFEHHSEKIIRNGDNNSFMNTIGVPKTKNFVYFSYCGFITIPHVSGGGTTRGIASVKENKSRDEIVLTCFPNPVVNNLNVTLKGNTYLSQIIISNEIGQRQFYKQYSSLVSEAQIDMSQLAKGVYWVQIRNINGEVRTKRIVKT